MGVTNIFDALHALYHCLTTPIAKILGTPLSRDGPVKVQMQGRDENTIRLPCYGKIMVKKD